LSSFTPPAQLNPLTKARSVDINNLSDAVATAFEALPSDADLNNGTVNFGTDSGTANTYIVTLPHTPTGYVDGLRVVFTPLFSNTGASTVNVNGLGVKQIKLQDNTATEPGTLVQGIPKTLIYGATLGNFFVEANSVTSAMTAAAAAAASASAAAGSASAASTSASNASTSATNASNSALAAAQSAIDAQAIQLVGTSTTSVSIGVGAKSYTASTGKQWIPDTPIQATDAANAANFNNGTVTSYNPTTGALVIDSTVTGGSGTIGNWNISVVGQRGQQGIAGNLSGGNLTGALNELRGSDLTAAATFDPWASGGNYEIVSGAAPITSISAAPQAGARRRWLCTAGVTITASASMVIKGIPSGQSYTCSDGDEIDIIAETTTKFRITINRGDGAAMAAMFGSFQNVITSEASGVFVAKRTGWHRITLIGSPGRAGAINSDETTARATGAGAGGFCVGVRFLIKGVSYPYTVGAPAAATNVGFNGVTNGVAGAASIFSLAGSPTMQADGGGAGAAQLTATAMTGGVGGSASGGDLNVKGGDGGDITGTSAGRAASGGGAVGVQGISPKGGSAAPSASGNICAAGGAGVGGDGGAAAGNTRGGGGGAGGAASGATGGVDYAGKVSTAVATVGPATATLENATAGGPNADAGPSRNGAGAAGQGASGNSFNSAPAALGGGGGLAYSADANVSIIAKVGAGGGPGGIVANYSSGQIVIPAGSSGKVYFEY